MSTGFSRKSAAMMVLGSSILAMGMCNIHAHSGVTEGGVLGLTLLLEHLFAISPAIPRCMRCWSRLRLCSHC